MVIRMHAVLLLLALSLAAGAQVRFGYLSCARALGAMPEMAGVESGMAALREQYDGETRLQEEEFNRKYESFLQGQATMAPGILRKRQAELEDLLERGLAFRKEAARLLEEAQAEFMEPLRRRLDAVLRELGAERGYAFILNTDNGGLPFADPECGEDVTDLVVGILQAGE